MTLFLQLPSTTKLLKIKCKDHSIIKKLSSKKSSNFINQKSNDIIINQDYWTTVPDTVRYRFKYVNNEFINLKIKNKVHSNSNYNEELLVLNKTNRRIIIILESPHLDEFTDNMKAISPAQGCTGKKIDSKVDLLLIKMKKVIEFTQNEVIEIALVNPVPFQTSLVNIHGKKLEKQYVTLRNNVWRSIWYHANYKEKFINLVNTLHSKDIIINACTYLLKKQISDALSEAQSFEGIIFNTYHPGARKNWLSKFEKYNR